MDPRPKTERPKPPGARAHRGSHRWLLFVHQLPSHPSNLRVRTWRRLQQLGAVPVKQAVYVLPDTPGAREDFEWLKTEVKGAGGDASVFAADNVDAWSDDALIEEFRRSRQDAYAALAREVEDALERTGTKRLRRARASSMPRLVGTFRARLAANEQVDFFGSTGRDRVVTLLKQLDELALGQGRRSASSKPAGGARGLDSYHGRLWVTRPRPGVDRLSSAWLIRRFIDPQARFGFAADRNAVASGAIPFDMFGVDFSHQGGGCTFETLCAVFGIREPAVARLAAIVHDLDLKDARFHAPEADVVGALIDGLQLAHEDDEALLAQGMALFEALYLAFDRSLKPARPRALARSRRSANRPRSPRTAR